MYKYISIALTAAVVLLLFVYVHEKNQRVEETTQLKNKIAEQEGTIKETQDIYSKTAVELSNLKADDKDLRNIIDSRDEKIASLLNLNLRLKDELLKSNNSRQSETKVDGEYGDSRSKNLGEH